MGRTIKTDHTVQSNASKGRSFMTNTNKFDSEKFSQVASDCHVAPIQCDRILRLSEVKTITGLGKSSIYSCPDFPARVEITCRAVGWYLSEVADWVKSRPQVTKGNRTVNSVSKPK